MAQLDIGARTLGFRLLYWGAEGAGKTTNLEAAHKKLPVKERGELRKLAHPWGGAGLAFDYEPADGGSATGVKARFQLEEAPVDAPPEHLASADGVIFVADARRDRLEANIAALAALERAWRAVRKDPLRPVTVFQWNRQDQADLLPAPDLAARLGVPTSGAFAASALRGHGVLATVRAAARQLLLRVARAGSASGSGRLRPETAPNISSDKDAEPPDHGSGEHIDLGDLEPIPSSSRSRSGSGDGRPSSAAASPSSGLSSAADLLAAAFPRANVDPLVGRSFAGCVVRSRLNQGAMGTLYLARDEVRELDVVVKLIRADRNSPSRVERFLLEARSAARVVHPNVVRVHEVGTDPEGRHFMVMDLAPGEDLARRVKRSGPLEPGEATQVVLAVARGLSAVHEAGMVHRDVKPENVVTDGPERVKLVDLGLVKDLETDLNLTLQGARVGTPIYMAPEVGQVDRIDGRADIYSLGLTWYHALTGHRPYTGQGLLDVLVGRRHLPPPESLNPAITPAMRRVLDRMCAGPRDERYPDARALAADLEALVEGREPAAAPGVPDVPWQEGGLLAAWLGPTSKSKSGTDRLSVGGLSGDLLEVAERLREKLEGPTEQNKRPPASR